MTRRNPLRLSPMRRSDLPGIARLERLVFAKDAWPLYCFRDYFREGGEGTISRRNGRIVGYSLFDRHRSKIRLASIGTTQAARGTGVGHELLAAVLSLLGPVCNKVILEVRESNTSAREFYRAHGFADCGQRRRYYHDGEDAILMCFVAQHTV